MTTKNDTKENVKDKLASVLFDLITDIPDSLHIPLSVPEEKVKRLTQQAALKAATVSATLSVPAGFTGVLTSIPDIVAVWKIQAQLVADIAATYGKLALLSREAMVWCLFRHSAASLLRDIAVRTGSRIVVQKISTTALKAILQKVGLKISTKFVGKTLVRAIPALGALGNGAYTYYDTNEVGKTAAAYFKALSDTDAPVPVETEETAEENSGES
ncbi:MAG: EcsC family protein [Fibrobacter sp.]|uniref:EcsC family protein n=1 Tax=Fibrobacter sp. TaxID=35828 RepID=UPI00388EE6A0|nr:EcsC family protein [Fibrobacter sp.]